MMKTNATELARNLLHDVRHAALATVNDDGSPHNTPYMFMYNPALTKLFWASNINSQHSKNVARDGRIFVVVFDSFTKGKGGLYITATNAHDVSGKELEQAVNVHNSLRVKYGSEPISEDYYTDGEQRMYAADISKLEVYYVERGNDGFIKEEGRKKVSAKDILG